jgi:hypothetical protein
VCESVVCVELFDLVVVYVSGISKFLAVKQLTHPLSWGSLLWTVALGHGAFLAIETNRQGTNRPLPLHNLQLPFRFFLWVSLDAVGGCPGLFNPAWPCRTSLGLAGKCPQMSLQETAVIKWIPLRSSDGLCDVTAHEKATPDQAHAHR